MKCLTLYRDGRLSLDDDGEVIWSADDDEQFQGEFGETVTSEQIEEVIDYLVETELLDDGEEFDTVDENDPDTQTLPILSDDDLPDDLPDDDDDDSDNPFRPAARNVH